MDRTAAVELGRVAWLLVFGGRASASADDGRSGCLTQKSRHSGRGLNGAVVPCAACDVHAACAACAVPQALSEVLPSVASRKLQRGGYMILRPDSGDPTEAVLMVRHASRAARTHTHTHTRADASGPTCMRGTPLAGTVAAGFEALQRGRRVSRHARCAAGRRRSAVHTAMWALSSWHATLVAGRHAQALHAAEKVFGSEVNGRGFRVIKGCGVIQGDGIDLDTLAKIAKVRIRTALFAYPYTRHLWPAVQPRAAAFGRYERRPVDVMAWLCKTHWTWHA
jgi:hypothetical protein